MANPVMSNDEIKALFADLAKPFKPPTVEHLETLPREPGPLTATDVAQANAHLVETYMVPDPGMLAAAEQALAAHRRAEDAMWKFIKAQQAFKDSPNFHSFATMVANTDPLTRPMKEVFDFVVRVLRPGGLPRDGPFVWCSTEADPTDTTDLEDIKMATHVILTPKGVGSFLNLQKPRAVTEGSEPRYSLTIIFNKDAQKTPEFGALQKGIDEALRERWPAKLPSGLISPFHDGAEKAGQYEGYKAGDIFISPWTKSAPGCVNHRREDIIDWSEFYAGWIVRANVRPFAYDKAGKRGCSFFLETVQFLKPGPRLDGRKPASQSFPEDDAGDEEDPV